MSGVMRLQKRSAYVAAATGLAVAALVALVLLSGSAQAAPAGGSSTKGSSPEPAASPTPRPIKLRPWVQFGHAAPGGVARYTDLLFNHVQTDTTVNVDAASFWQGWGVVVSPTTTTALPGYANIIHIAVSVPNNPAHRIDVEGVRAVTATGDPYHHHSSPHHHHASPPVDRPGREQLGRRLRAIPGRPERHIGLSRRLVPPERPGYPRTVRQDGGARHAVAACHPATPSFSDVPADFWGYSYIETAVAHGAISGYPDGTFRPNSDVTRAQVAKIIYLARRWSTVEGSVRFNDVQQSDWFYTYVQAAGVSEIMGGYSDSTFRPNLPATRAQVAKILTLSLYSEPTN